MYEHLQQRVKDLLHRYSSATLATCGPAGPQISTVSYSVQQLSVYLTLPQGSDHVFNLETEPLLVLMTPAWRLHGQGATSKDIQQGHASIIVTATRLHILDDDGQNTIETIDF